MRQKAVSLVFVWAAFVLSRGARAQFSQQGPKLVGTGAVGAAVQGLSAAIAADGNTAIVGGDNDGGGAGAMWVWTRSGGVWTQQGPKLVGSGAVGNAAQGFSVAISGDGNTAIVGGIGDDNENGAAWVWTRSGGVWTQQGPKLVGSGAVNVIPASQGYAVALSSDGNTAMVGGRRDNGAIGAVWVWTRSGGVWTQQGPKLVGSGGGGDQGSSVALSADGNTAIVGGPFDGGGIGAAWVWTRSGGVWTQQGSKLVGSGALGSALQGFSVSIAADGNTAMIGGPFSNGGVGAAWAWTRSGGVWTQQGTVLLASDAVGNSTQGWSVSLSGDGNKGIIGGQSDNGAKGAAFVWTRSGGVWTEQGSKLVGSGAIGLADQGYSLSLTPDGNTAVVGGPGDNSDAGAAWIFAVLPSADLAITKSVAGEPPFNAGGSVTYAISIVNNGPDAASGVTVTDTPPAGMSFVSATPSQGSCSGTATVTCAMGTLAKGSSATIALVVTTQFAGQVSNTATVSGGQTDPNPANNSSTATITVSPSADLAIAKSVAGAPPFKAGSNLTYTIVIKNNGPNAASNVIIDDMLPAGTSLVSVTPSQGSCGGNTLVSCLVGALANGGSATITLVVTAASTPGQVSNTATVSGSQADLKPANNSSTATITTVNPAAVPAASWWTLIALAGALALLGAMRRAA